MAHNNKHLVIVPKVPVFLLVEIICLPFKFTQIQWVLKPQQNGWHLVKGPEKLGKKIVSFFVYHLLEVFFLIEVEKMLSSICLNLLCFRFQN